MEPVTNQHRSASLLLAGPDGGEVRKVLGIRVAFSPPALEREAVKVDRAPVNNVHNDELGLSAKRAGTAALQLLFREINHNEPVQRLWIDIEPPSLQVTGRSAELLFGLATYLHLGGASLPESIPNSDYIATGLLDAEGNVGSVEAVAVKVRAALATGMKDGTRLFYPRADENQIDDALRAECRSHGLILCPVDRIDEALDALGVPILGSWPSGTSPFRALEAFDASFSRVFFGRQREVEALTLLLESRAAAGRPGALIIGASGAGKSSFCLAGMLPALIKQKPGLQYAVWRPRDAVSGLGDEPADEQKLAASILSQWQVRDDKQLGMALAHVPKDAAGLDELPECLAATASQCSIFVIDQFEELFTLNFTAQARIGFARLLQSLQARGIWVIGTLRSEFYASYLELCDEHGQVVLTPLFEGDGQCNLPRMSRDAFSQVITRPAELAGLQFEQRADGVSLSQTLLADAMATDDALPLLGFALQKLYDEMERPEAADQPDAAFPRTLGIAAYEQLGGLAGAIGTVAAEAYAALDPQAQAELPGLLSALAVPSADGTRETARPAPIEQWPLGTAGRRLIDALIAIRVLVSEQGSTPASPAVVRVTHEALFSHWELAAQQLSDSRQNRLLIEDFRHRAALWDDEGRGEGSLLSSPRDIANGRAVLPLIPVSDRIGPLMAFVEGSIARFRRKRMILYSSSAAAVLMLAGLTGYTLIQNDQLQAKIVELDDTNRELDTTNDKLASTNESLETTNNALAKSEDTAKTALDQAEQAAAAERQQRAEALRQRDVALAATRVAKEQRELAEAQTLEARQQRSRAVAQLAEQAIESGDAMTGILLARSQLQPGDEANWTGAAQSALLHGVLENREIAVIGGHDEPIDSAELSPDGRQVVTVSSGRTARVWTLDGDQPTSEVLAGHTSTVVGATFSPDGRQVVTASIDRTARVWRLDGGQAKSFILVGHTDWVNSAAFSHDGQRVVTSSNDGTARVWTLDGDQTASVTLAGHTGWVNGAAFSRDDTKVVTASNDGTARVWTLDGGQPTSVVLAGHMGVVVGATFSPDGRRVVTASNDGTARVWTLDSEQPTSVALVGHTDWVIGAAFSHGGQHVVTSSNDGTARVWTLDGNQTSSVVLDGHQRALTGAAFSADDRHVLTTSYDRTARIWALDGDRPTSSVLVGHTSWVASAAFRPTEGQVVTASDDGTVRVWMLGDRLPNSVTLGENHEIEWAAFSPDGKRAVTTSVDGTARIWTLDRQQPTSVILAGHQRSITNAAFSPDGQQVVTASTDGTARVWTLAGERPTSVLLAGHTQWITSAMFTPSGRQVFTASYDGTVRVWNLDGDQPSSEVIIRYGRALTRAALSSDGRHLVTGARDGTAQVWALNSDYSNPIVLAGHQQELTSVAFSPDGRRVLTASHDGTARVWTLAGEHPTSVVLAGHTAWVTSAMFSPDGQHVVTASYDGTARVWTSDRGQFISVALAGHRGFVKSAEFSPDGRHVLTASWDKTAQVWYVPYGRELWNLSSTMLTRCLSDVQLSTFGIARPERAESSLCN